MLTSLNTPVNHDIPGKQDADPGPRPGADDDTCQRAPVVGGRDAKSRYCITLVEYLTTGLDVAGLLAGLGG